MLCNSPSARHWLAGCISVHASCYWLCLATQLLRPNCCGSSHGKTSEGCLFISTFHLRSHSQAQACHALAMSLQRGLWTTILESQRSYRRLSSHHQLIFPFSPRSSSKTLEPPFQTMPKRQGTCSSNNEAASRVIDHPASKYDISFGRRRGKQQSALQPTGMQPTGSSRTMRSQKYSMNSYRINRSPHRELRMPC